MLEVTDLSVSYGAISALRGISLKVGAGAIVTLIGGNGAGYAASDLHAAQSEFTGLAQAAAACASRLDELGVQIKDPDTGLLDFPARRDGRDVLLCWRVGEAGVTHWHGLEEGFAGRKPIDWGE